MAKRIKDTEYLYLSSMLAARSSRLLSRDRMERMLDAPSFAESAKMLTECGYADMSDMDAKEVEAALARRRSDILGELARIAPAPELVDIFRLKYDYHNAKVAIKAAAAGQDGAYLYSSAGRVAPELVAGACTSEEPVSIPTALMDAITEARAIMARTANPQSADIYLDKACYAEMADIAKGTGSGFLPGYVRFLIDSVNLKTAVRVIRMGGDHAFLMGSLIPGGNVDPELLTYAAAAGDFGSTYVSTPLQEAAAAAAEAMKGGPLTSFELLCDNAEARYLRSSGLAAFGEEPVVAYIVAAESEITAVRMILTGLLAGLSPDSIRERLREVS